MTTTRRKQIQAQIDDLRAELRKDEALRLAAEVVENENKYLGKCYKWKRDNETIYCKVISAINGSAYNVWALEFVLPISATFKKKMVLNQSYLRSNLDYDFYDPDMIWLEDIHISSLDNTTIVEIPPEEYYQTMETLFKEIINFSNRDFTVKKVLGEEYAKNAKEFRLQALEEKQDIPKENKENV